MIDTTRSVVWRTPSAAALLGLAAVFALAVAAIDAAFVHTVLGQRLDNAALLGRAGVPADLIAEAWSVLDTISAAFLGGAALAIGIVGLVRHRSDLAGAAAVVLVGSNVTTQVLKRILLTRPELLDGGVKAYNTLPSGHATVALSVGAAAVIVASPRHRSLIAWLGAGYAGAVGVATVVAGWHRPSDAAAAWGVVGVWVALVAAVLVRRSRSRSPAVCAPDRGEVLLWLAAVAFLAATLAGGLALGVAAGASHSGEFAGLGLRSLAFLTAAVGIVASALAVIATLLGGIRAADPPS